MVIIQCGCSHHMNISSKVPTPPDSATTTSASCNITSLRSLRLSVRKVTSNKSLTLPRSSSLVGTTPITILPFLWQHGQHIPSSRYWLRHISRSFRFVPSKFPVHALYRSKQGLYYQTQNKNSNLIHSLEFCY